MAKARKPANNPRCETFFFCRHPLSPTLTRHLCLQTRSFFLYHTIVRCEIPAWLTVVGLIKSARAYPTQLLVKRKLGGNFGNWDFDTSIAIWVACIQTNLVPIDSSLDAGIPSGWLWVHGVLDIFSSSWVIYWRSFVLQYLIQPDSKSGIHSVLQPVRYIRLVPLLVWYVPTRPSIPNVRCFDQYIWWFR